MWTAMLVTCPNCGAKNRVDEARAHAQQPVCGRCHTRLNVPGAQGGAPVELNEQRLDAFLRDAGGTPVLVDCWAPWCGPCRMLAPTIDQLAAESAGRYIIAKLNTDQNPAIAARYRIDGIPAMLIFKNSQLVDRIVGLYPKPEIEKRLNMHAASA
jgi:thioredoxin